MTVAKSFNELTLNAYAIRLSPIVATVLTLSTALATSPALAQDRPLLVEGKTLLFQRVLTRPGVDYFVGPGDPDGTSEDLPPFTPYFVYSREVHGQDEWLEIGGDSVGSRTGWVQATDVIEWRHTLSIAFTNTAGRQRLPFFRERGDLEGLVADEKVTQKTDQIVKDLERGLVGPDYPAIAIEPEAYTDIRDNFYLLPILDFSDALSFDFYQVRLLKIASASARDLEAEAAQDNAGAQTPAGTQADPAALALATDPANSSTGDPAAVNSRQGDQAPLDPAAAATNGLADPAAPQAGTTAASGTPPQTPPPAPGIIQVGDPTTTTADAPPAPPTIAPTGTATASSDPAIATQPAADVQASAATQQTADAGAPTSPADTIAAPVQSAPTSSPQLQTPTAGPMAGVAFVIDTTSSMGPYIESTREVVASVSDKLAQEGLLANASFALVGYRDNVDVAPGLEYVSRVFVDFKDGADPATFADRAKTVAAASVSSQNFNEDVYSGVRTALRDLDWSGIDAKFVVVIGDAGPRPRNDPLSGTQMGANDLIFLADGTAIITIHLKTPEGRNNHDSAAREFSALSNFGNFGTLYFGLETGDRAKFKDGLNDLSFMFNAVIQTSLAATPVPANTKSQPDPAGQPDPSAQADPAAQPDPTVQPDPATQPDPAAQPAQGDPTPQADPTLAVPIPPPPASLADDPNYLDLRRKIEDVGVAMRLAYLGRIKNEVPPSVFEAWVADRDLSNPTKKAIDVRVLMTRSQLSDLQTALRTIVREGQMGQIAPDEFFGRLKSAAAAIAKDPDSVANSGFTKIGDVDVLKEYLGDLPYQSTVMNVTQDEWLSYSIDQQQEFIESLISKIRLYTEFNDDADRWTNFGILNQNEELYPVPLDALP